MVILLYLLTIQSEFLKNLYERWESPCPTCHPGPPIQQRQSGRNLMVFISFSVPLESWKDLSAQLEKTDGVFVLKGIPDNSFEKLSEKLVELKAAGVNAPIDIDPEKFETHGIVEVPAFVLEEGPRTDKIFGNIRLDTALREIAEKGEMRDMAKEIYQMLSNQT